MGLGSHGRAQRLANDAQRPAMGLSTSAMGLPPPPPPPPPPAPPPPPPPPLNVGLRPRCGAQPPSSRPTAALALAMQSLTETPL